jgi:predicted nucleic acid-binding protein
MNVLVDTSIWSLAFRRKHEHLNAAERLLVAELIELIGEGRARMIGVVRQELLSGIKTTAQFEKLQARLRAFPDEFVETLDYETAARASNACLSKGIVGSIVDMLICALALRHNLTVFTTDSDFKNYSQSLPLQFHSPRQLGRKGN